MPTVSIIVPVYNVEKYLPRCVDSILSQTYPDFELILVDDGSPDRCGIICDEYAARDSRIVVIHKENGGVSAARNSALDIARGDYVAFCDSDDFWNTTYMEQLMQSAINYTADIVVANYKAIDEIGNEKYQSKHTVGQTDISALSEKWWYITHGVWGNQHGWEIWTRLFRAEIITKNKLRFCTTCDNYAEDLTFVLSFLLFANRICSIAEVGYNYVIHDGSMMRNSEHIAKFSHKNEASIYLSNIYNQVFANSTWQNDYPILHFLFMQQEYMKLVATPQYKNLHYEVAKIEHKEWFLLQTKRIFTCYKKLKYYFGTRAARQILLLSHYCLHGNWERFKIESAIAYRWFIKN